jgi:hypothetical protein
MSPLATGAGRSGIIYNKISSQSTSSNPIITLSPIIWYDFNDVSTVTLSGSTITQIADKGLRGWTLTKSTIGPNQSTWTNGLKCCDWGSAGHSNYLRNVNAISTNISEIYIVLDANYGSTFPTYNGLVSGIAAGSWNVPGNQGTSGFYFNPSGVRATFDATYLNNGASNVYSSGILPGINTRSLLRIKNVDGSSLTAIDGFQIGNERSTGPRGWGGLIAEIIVFSNVLDPTNRTTLQSYLASKWDLTLS